MYLCRKPKNASLLDSAGRVADVPGRGRGGSFRAVLALMAAGASEGSSGRKGCQRLALAVHETLLLFSLDPAGMSACLTASAGSSGCPALPKAEAN